MTVITHYSIGTFVFLLKCTLVPSVFVLFDQRSGERPDLKSENTGLPVELSMPAFSYIFGQQTKKKGTVKFRKARPPPPPG